MTAIGHGVMMSALAMGTVQALGRVLMAAITVAVAAHSIDHDHITARDHKEEVECTHRMAVGTAAVVMAVMAGTVEDTRHLNGQ